MASCADEFDRNFQVDRPAKTAEYAYLNDYKALKEYVSDPNFHLGVGTDAAEYANQGAAYVITNVNFNETVAGNAMKMASCIDDNGNMNFSTVESYVKEAANAGINVFGHTLAWHSQQSKKWLESLLKDKPVQSDGEGNRYLQYDNGDGKSNSWDAQAIYSLPTPMTQGKTYVVKVKVKSTAGGDLALWPIWDASPNKNQWGGSNDVQYLATYQVGTDFTEYVWEFVASFPHDKLQFVFGQLKGKIGFDDLSVMEKGSDVEMVKNGSFDEDPNGWGNNWNGPSFGIATAAAAVGIPCLTYNNGEGKTNSWDAQAICDLATPMVAGKTYVVTVTAQTDNGGPLALWPIWNASPNKNQWGGSNDVQYLEEKTVGTKFAEYVWEFNANFNIDRLQFVFGKLQGKIYFQTVSCVEKDTNKELMASTDFKSSSMAGWSNNWNGPSYGIETVSVAGIPLTDQEKKDTLTYAMDKWISGMMDACKDDDGNMLVKAWDVVNEPIGANGELQHGQEGDKENFFWQDYLGDLDYVRTAVKLARQYGGNDLKLFINDYNLEYDWDAKGNTKLEALISWIKKWEADGVTKIDGIGSQMHLSCYGNADEQAKRKALIEKSFEMMAATGKLVRVSELDMGYVDADGNAVKTADMTEEMHHQMADFYKWIIETYMAKVPAAQQWGITLWCPTDAPAGSGWRAGEPVGIWDQNYYRKHVYAGIADGLSGK